MSENVATGVAGEPLEKSPLLELAHHLLSPQVGALAAGVASGIAEHSAAHKAAHMLTHHIGENQAVVHHSEDSAVVGHHYSMVGKDKKAHTYQAVYSSHHGVRMNHVPQAGEKKLSPMVMSHDDFRHHFHETGRIRDAEPGSGTQPTWFGRGNQKPGKATPSPAQAKPAKTVNVKTKGVAKSEDGDSGEGVGLDLVKSGPLVELAQHLVNHHHEIGEGLRMMGEHAAHLAESAHHLLAHHAPEMAVKGASTAAAFAGGRVGMHAARQARETVAKIGRHEPYHVKVHNVEGSAHVGHDYHYGGHRYHAVHSDHEGVMFDPHPAENDRAHYSPMFMDHKEVKGHFKAGRMQGLGPSSGGDVHKSEEFEATVDAQEAEVTLKKSDGQDGQDEQPVAAFTPEVIAVSEEPVPVDSSGGYSLMVGDVATDMRASTFIIKSVERGMVVMERDGKQSSSMNERDVLRFFATPGTVVRRLGKTVFKA